MFPMIFHIKAEKGFLEAEGRVEVLKECDCSVNYLNFPAERYARPEILKRNLARREVEPKPPPTQWPSMNPLVGEGGVYEYWRGVDIGLIEDAEEQFREETMRKQFNQLMEGKKKGRASVAQLDVPEYKEFPPEFAAQFVTPERRWVLEKDVKLPDPDIPEEEASRPIEEYITEDERKHNERFKSRVEMERVFENVLRGVDKKIQGYYSEPIDYMEDRIEDAFSHGEIFPSEWAREEITNEDPDEEPATTLSELQDEYDEALEEYYNYQKEMNDAERVTNPTYSLDEDLDPELDYSGYEPGFYKNRMFKDPNQEYNEYLEKEERMQDNRERVDDFLDDDED